MQNLKKHKEIANTPEVEKVSLIKEIDLLDVEIANNKKISSVKQENDTIQNLKVKLDSKKSTLGNVLNKASILNQKKHRAIDAPFEAKKLSLKEEISILNTEIIEKKGLVGEYEITEKDIEYKKDILDKLDNKVDSKKEELSDMEASIHKTKATEQSVLSVVLDKEKEKEGLVNYIKDRRELFIKLSKDIEVIENRTDNLTKVAEEKERKIKLLSSLREDIADSNNSISELDIDILELRAIKEQLNNTLKDIKQDIANKKDNIESREGDLSIRESWITKKEKRLKQLKSELEKYYQRKFPYINI